MIRTVFRIYKKRQYMVLRQKSYAVLFYKFGKHSMTVNVM